MGLLRNLSYLQEVAKTKSINKAADNLYISKSALSSALKNLEEEMGVPLLNRTVQGVTLTNAGELVLERSALIFNILDSMRNDCAVYSCSKKEINIFTEPQFASSLFPHIVSEIMLYNPNYYITTHSASVEEIIAAVKQSENNIGLVLSSVWKSELLDKDSLFDDLIFKQIASFKLCVVTAKYSKHVSLNVKELSYADIVNIPQIELLQNEKTSSQNLLANISAPSNCNYVMSTDSNIIYFQAILNDIGIGNMINLNMQFGLVDRNKLRFIPLSDSDDISLYVIFNKNANTTMLEPLCDVIQHAVN